MESLYSTVEIVKKLSDKKSIINYYLLDDGDKYGVKITKTCNDKIVGEDEVVMKCLSKEKGVVTNLIDNLTQAIDKLLADDKLRIEMSNKGVEVSKDLTIENYYNNFVNDIK